MWSRFCACAPAGPFPPPQGPHCSACQLASHLEADHTRPPGRHLLHQAREAVPPLEAEVWRAAVQVVCILCGLRTAHRYSPRICAGNVAGLQPCAGVRDVAGHTTGW
eukprot:111831-Chlamydomonas_euryale.AAC.5